MSGRVCIDCGRQPALDHRCPGCQRMSRPCTGCGRSRLIVGSRCGRCNRVQSECVDCGVIFAGRAGQCRSCRTPYRLALERAQGNRRRALRFAAEIAGPVPAETYAAIRAEGPCVYCGAPAVQVDHVRPLARGGAEHESNLVPACRSCNASKGDRLLTGWEPGRVAYGARMSAKVATELARLRKAA